MDNEKYRDLIDTTYSKARYLNDQLLKKSNTDNVVETSTFEESMLFYISSHSLSFLKSLYLDLNYSNSTIFNARCIIEGYAMLMMSAGDKISDRQKRLFLHQYKIYEYRIYDRYDNVKTETTIFSINEKSYAETVEMLKETYPEYDANQIKNVVKSKLPFLGDPTINFETIVKENTTPNLLKTYKLFSLLIHPHDFGGVKYSDFFMFFIDVLTICTDLFTNYPGDYINRISVELMRFSSGGTALSIKETTKKQTILLTKFSKSFEEYFNNNFISNIILDIVYVMHDITYDFILGYTEHLRMKWKLLVEMLAVTEYVYFKNHNHYELLKMHTYYKIQENLGEEKPEIIEDAYRLFCKIYDVKFSKVRFTSIFKKTLGFLISKDGKMMDLKELAFAKISDFSNARTNLGKVSFMELLRVSYDESQIMSHANGYLYFANHGAWSEDINIIIAFDELISIFIHKLFSLFNLNNKLEEQFLYPRILESLKHGKKRFQKLSKDKHKLITIPRILKQ